jgi:O-glycosyl hydrolase
MMGCEMGFGLRTWRTCVVAGVCVWGCLCGSVRAAEKGGAVLTVDLADKRQTIEGFGGSIAAWGTKADNAALEHALNGLGTTFVRLKGEGPGRMAECPDTWRRVMRLRPDTRMFISFWRPQSDAKPDKEYWTRTVKDEKGNEHVHIRDERLDEWADEIVARVRRFKVDYGLPVVAVSPQNEANWRQFCEWSPEALTAFIKDRLAPRMKKAGLAGIDIVAPEYAYLAMNAYSANKYHAVNTLTEVDVIGYHIYDIIHEKGVKQTGIDKLFEHQRAMGAYMRKHFGPPDKRRGGKRVWMTETSGAWRDRMGWSEEMDEHDRAIVAAQYIHAVLSDAESNAFFWWGLVYQDMPPGDPDERTLQKFRDEGLVLVRRGRINGLQPFRECTRKYYAFKQFSRFVRPGAVRVGVRGDEALQASAYLSKDGKSLTVVVINAGKTARAVDVQAVANKKARALHLTAAYRTDRSLSCVPVKSPRALPPESVTTMVFQLSATAEK